MLLLDRVDYPLLCKYRFRRVNTGRPGQPCFYWRARINGKNVYLHRVIVGAVKGQVVDHRNGDHDDNRRSNLRTTTQTINCQNRRPEFQGRPNFHPKCTRRPWVARASIGHKTIYLGAYAEEHEAAAVIERFKKENYEGYIAS